VIPLGAIVRLALFYGVAGFGGGFSVLSQLRRRIVEQNKWITAEDFLVLAELSKSLPGTPATTLIALLGQRVGGVRGGALAAFAFLLPSTALMIACGAAYSTMRQTTWLAPFFDGMACAMVGVVAATTIDLARSALRNRFDVLAALACAALLALHVVSEPVIAFAAVAIGALRAIIGDRGAKNDEPKSERLHAIGWPVVLGVAGAGALAGLVRVFVPIGVLTFGGGLAMVPAIEHTVVIQERWLDAKTFADAVALGQITPGPVAICATFIGYRVSGVVGALVATFAMFAPAIAVALAVGHSVDRFRRSRVVESALRALAPAVIGMLLAATISLGRASVHDALAAIVAVLALGVLVRFRASPLWTLVGGGIVFVVRALAV